MNTTPAGSKLERNLAWGALLLLTAGCLLVMLPFVSALLWAIILSFASWPVYQRLLRLMRNRHTLAALVMSLGMIVVVLLPFVIVGISLADNVRELTVAAKHWVEAGPPGPPAWLAKIPLVGERLTDQWQSLVADSSRLRQEARKLIEPISSALLALGLLLGAGLMQMALSIFIAFFLFRDGESLVGRVRSAVQRIGGERGGQLLTIAGNTIRGVVYGILGTALVQAVMAAIGFVVAGVPGAMVLGLLTFFLSVVPMGPPLVWIPAAIWLFSQGRTGWGIFMVAWGLAVSSVDNFVKPWLISQGSNMPFLLIFFGVLGGALAFGFIGVFLGPTLLAVGWRLVDQWMSKAARANVATPKA